jgi:hypothetical protein
VQATPSFRHSLNNPSRVAGSGVVTGHGRCAHAGRSAEAGVTSSSEEKLGGRFSIACPLSVALVPWSHRYGPAKLDFRTWQQSAAVAGQAPELQRCPSSSENRHVSVRHNHEANTVRRVYLGALRLGPLAGRWLPPPWWPGASAWHRTPPRRARRSHDAPAGLMTGGGPPKRTGDVAGSPAFMAVPATSVPASAARVARAAVRQSAGTTQRPAADSRWPCVRVSCGAGAGWSGRNQGSGVRAAVRCWPHASRY